MNLNFTIKTYAKLNKNEKDILLESYRKYYNNIYGIDVFDAFLMITETESFLYSNKDIIKDYSINYNKAVSLFNNTEILEIFKDNNIVGTVRIMLNNDIAKILDIIFININNKERRNIWVKVVKYIENYLISKKYKKMYIEIPLLEGPLLIRANELGFIEDESSLISGFEKTYTFIKSLGDIHEK